MKERRAMGKPRVVMIGIGNWGKNIARNFAELSALAGIVEASEARREFARQKHPDVPLFESLAEASDAIGFDAVAIATPAPTHASVALEALRRGYHTFVEKPLALRVEDGVRLVAAARDAGKKLMVGHLLLHHPAIRKIKELIDDGSLGALRTIYSHRLNLGTVRKEENALWSFAPHDISVILHLLSEVPTEIQCSGGAFLQPGIHDTTLTALSFPSGAFAHIYVSWLHPFKEHRLVVVGDKRMAVFEDTRARDKLLLFDCGIDFIEGDPVKRYTEAVPVEYPQIEPLRTECQHFLESIAKDEAPLTDGENGLEVLRVLERAQAALVGKAAAAPAYRSTAQDGAYFVHDTAIVDDGVSIGRGTKIWHWSHVQSGARIGEKCVLGQNVNVGNNVVIGKGCKIQNNVSVYEGVELGDYVFCGPSMVFTNVIDPRSEFPQRGSEHYLPTKVGKSASIGANATIVCGSSIGEYAFVGAGAVVTKDVEPHALVLGNPARRVGTVCRCGKTLWWHAKPKPKECKKCGFVFSE
ncbi:MAG: Gfo/Idh/MocA family oxidoreductase [Acidobacteriota bacterium]|nr:Gfo/Idh/MocA family oxidoreductase [Acidobacteriota bacterium]